MTNHHAGSATGIDLARELFDAAIDAAYPIPDSPHTSVMQRANDSRAAYTRGWQAALARATPQHSVAEQAAAWANWKVGTDSYVPFKTRDEAEASVRRSDIAATQEGPYEAVPLFHRQSARAQPLASTAATQPEQDAMWDKAIEAEATANQLRQEKADLLAALRAVIESPSRCVAIAEAALHTYE